MSMRNTLYVPPKQFFDAPEWAGITDWADELAPCLDQADPDARRRSLPVHADRRRSGPAAGRDRHGQRGDVQQGPGGRLLRHAGCRGRRSVLRRGWAAAHRLHLVRQLQHRLRPQRQEQADDELPLPGREARRADPRTARGVRPHPARRRRVRGARASSRLGAASGAPPPSHVHRRAGDRRRPRRTARRSSSITCSTRAASPACRASSGNERGRTPNSFSTITRTHGEWKRDPEKIHITPGSVAITSGVWPDAVTSIEPTYWGVGSDVFAFLGTYHQHGEQKHPTASWLKELVATPGRGARLRRPAPLVRAQLHRAVHADDRHLDRAVLARRPAAEPAIRNTSLGAHLRSIEDFVDRCGKEAGQPRGGAADRGHQPQRLRPLRRRDPDRRQQRNRRRRPLPARCSASRAFTSWTGA